MYLTRFHCTTHTYDLSTTDVFLIMIMKTSDDTNGGGGGED